jgi:hypothetical protein
MLRLPGGSVGMKAMDVVFTVWCDARCVKKKASRSVLFHRDAVVCGYRLTVYG